MFAILLNPLQQRFEKYFPRILATLCTVTVGLIFIGGIFFFLIKQVNIFMESLPALKESIITLYTQLQHWLQIHTGMSLKEQASIIGTATDSSASIITQTLG